MPQIPGKAFRHQKQNVTQTAGYDTIKSEDTIRKTADRTDREAEEAGT